MEIHKPSNLSEKGGRGGVYFQQKLKLLLVWRYTSHLTSEKGGRGRGLFPTEVEAPTGMEIHKPSNLRERGKGEGCIFNRS